MFDTLVNIHCSHALCADGVKQTHRTDEFVLIFRLSHSYNSALVVMSNCDSYKSFH